MTMSKGHVSYCLFEDGDGCYIEVAWAPVRKDTKIISKHKTYEQALQAQTKWYAEHDYDTVFGIKQDKVWENLAEDKWASTKEGKE